MMEKDLIVIGGGPSGLAAAITAKENGIEDIIIIEKMNVLSGNSKFAMNFYDMPNSKAMKENGVDISKEEFINTLINKGAWETSERLEAWADSAWSLDKWLRRMGAELNYHFGGEQSTNHLSEKNEYAGKHIQKAFENRIKELEIETQMETSVTDLLYREDRVVGVQVSDYENTYNIFAKAVIITAGGFSANKDLLAEYVPGAEILETTNQEGAEGDFIYIARQYNFMLEHMEALKIPPAKLKDEHYLTGSGDGYILVNENSERFMDETTMGIPRAKIIQKQPNGNAYYIIDEERKEAQPNRRKHAELGYYVVGENLKDLAEKLQLDGAKLEKEILMFNEAVEKGSGDPYREKPSQFKLDPTGPIYATLIEPAVHMTNGGIVANEHAQVLTNNNKVVPGLYAAGEVTNQSRGFSQSVTFGRIAGDEATKFISS